jgi:hypothetical protein
MAYKTGLLILTLALFAGHVEASSFKCNNHFVSVGDGKASVLLRCGEPLFAEVVSGDNDVKVEEWTYKSRAYKGYLRVLKFRGGRLVDISVSEKVD